MPKRGKNYREVKKKIDTQKRHDFMDAVTNAIETSYAKFDETIDVAVRLGVDPRHADQMVRGTVVLPNGIGKEVKVLVFAKGEKEKRYNKVEFVDVVMLFRPNARELFRCGILGRKYRLCSPSLHLDHL